MRELAGKRVTSRHAWAIAGTICVALLALMIGGAVVPNSAAVAVLAILLGPTIFIWAGSLMAALSIENGACLSWGRFLLVVIDMALLPVVPLTFMALGVLVWIPLALLASRWFGDFHGTVMAVEYASFAWLLLMPYGPLLWPIILRNRIVRNDAENVRGVQVTLSWRLLIWLYLAATALVILTRPTVVFVITFVVSWVAVALTYRSLVLPNAPRYLCTLMAAGRESSR